MFSGGLVKGNNCRKTPHLVCKPFVSSRFSLKPITNQWKNATLMGHHLDIDGLYIWDLMVTIVKPSRTRKLSIDPHGPLHFTCRGHDHLHSGILVEAILGSWC